MAAATTSGSQKRSVFGDQRYIGFDTISFAANGDTWTVPGIKHIDCLALTCTTNTAFGFTIAANVVTLVSAGALDFRGGAIGQ